MVHSEVARRYSNGNGPSIFPGILGPMPLTRGDCAILIGDVQRLLREYDPLSYEVVLNAVGNPEDSRQYLTKLIRTVTKVYTERSGGQYGAILDSVNHHGRLSDGGPVRGLSVILSPTEREIYQREEISLAELPDRSDFVSALDRLSGILESEIDWLEGL